MIKIYNLSSTLVFSTENVTESNRSISDDGIITQTSITGKIITQRLYQKYIYEFTLKGIKRSDLDLILNQLNTENNHCLIEFSKVNFGLTSPIRGELKIIDEDDTIYLGDSLTNPDRKVDIILEFTPIN